MTKSELFISRWLMICVGMVIIMVGIGGYTRLSGSGLSIVEWNPIIGLIPPLTEASWLNEFAKYQSSPEYQQVNIDMSLIQFKTIYLVEYFHRLWGRAMGLVLAVPTIYAFFKYRKAIPGLLVVWGTAFAQAAMGWYMVKSGLVKDPMVSPYRLTAHLLLALALLALLIKNMPLLAREDTRKGVVLLKKPLGLFLIFVTLTVTYGGLTAGTHAGFIYNTFPDMNGQFIPEEFLAYQPWWKDLVTNPASIQFVHRILAMLTTVMGIHIYLSSRNLSLSPSLKKGLFAVAILVTTQFGLGIMTLLLQVPLALGVAHQVCATILFTVVLGCCFKVGIFKSRVSYSMAGQNA